MEPNGFSYKLGRAAPGLALGQRELVEQVIPESQRSLGRCMAGALRATVSASPHISLNRRPALCLSRKNWPAAATGSDAYRPTDCSQIPRTQLNPAVHAADMNQDPAPARLLPYRSCTAPICCQKALNRPRTDAAEALELLIR
jgi:hypothetical protein